MRSVIGVLRGGPSSEYDFSLKSGASVLEHLDKEKYEPRDLFISKAGEWHLHGAPVTPERALRGVEVAFNTVHGQYGEDGQLQRILETLGVAYTGPNPMSAALTFDKQATKDAVALHGIKIVHGAVVDSQKITDLEKTAFNIFRSMPHPFIVKPVTGGSSIGISKVENFHSLEAALTRAFKISPTVLVEEFIPGKEASVGVIDNFRNEKTYTLMPVEYGSQTDARVPGNFSKEEKNELARLARTVHEALALPHYSRSDFIVSKRGIYFLEVNSAPGIGFTDGSLFPKALHAVGASMPHFLDHIITLAKNKHD